LNETAKWLVLSGYAGFLHAVDVNIVEYKNSSNSLRDNQLVVAANFQCIIWVKTNNDKIKPDYAFYLIVVNFIYFGKSEFPEILATVFGAT